MPYLSRILNLPKLLEKKSFFLFGPRATGKSTLIREQFSENVLVINLLRTEYYFKLNNHPEALESIIMAHEKPDAVIIDEVQRIPMLLNEVHRLIEEKNITFLLTGSSARTLKKQHVNLLAGRAWTAEFMPLTFQEIPNFDLHRYLQYGGLPAVYLGEEPEEELDAYVSTYLREEIQAEALVRKLTAFSKFLEVSALTHGQMINFTAIASDTGLPVTTVRSYYQVLEDTLIGFIVPAWTKTVKRKAVSTAKFYYFDPGVCRTLAGLKTLEPGTREYGQAFEHFIACELRAYLSYQRKKLKLSYWRSKHGTEVDFIVGDTLAIEVKSSSNIHDKHLKNLQRLREENICQHYVIVSQDPIRRHQDGVDIIPWQDFLQSLWQDRWV